MSVPAALRVGWCPGALRPMRAGDGLLVRLKPRGNRLTIAEAEGVADAARMYGNGVLTITGRANLQVRGVTDDSLPDLTDHLSRLGLLDPSPESEAARNVVSNPLAGVDPRAPVDIRPLVALLESALVRDPRFHRLPAKFSWNVDDGGAMGLDSVGADVRFRAVVEEDAAIFQVRLGNEEATACSETQGLPQVALALTESFLALCVEHRVVPHRMADLVAVCGAAAVFDRAGLKPAGRASVLPRTGVPMVVGPVLLSSGTTSVGVAPAFGRLEADGLERLASVAARCGAVELRLTPWRSLLIPGLTDAAAGVLQEAAEQAGLITDPADPRLAIAACTGAPACSRAGAPVQEHAASWAKLLRATASQSIRLHVSGCAKGCAQGSPVPLTLVAHEGRYAVVHRGRAADVPTRAGLSVEAVAAMLRAGAEAGGEARP